MLSNFVQFSALLASSLDSLLCCSIIFLNLRAQLLLLQEAGVLLEEESGENIGLNLPFLGCAKAYNKM